MDHDIVYYHQMLQRNIHIVEHDESNEEALNAVKDAFLKVFDMIKMIMITKQDRYYGCFLMNFELSIDFHSYHDAGVSIDVYPFRMTINPLLLGLHTLPEIVYTICHEIEHIVLNHPSDGVRYNLDKDPAIGCKLNFAMDASINDRLTMDSSTNKQSVMAEPNDVITSRFLSDFYDYYFSKIPDRNGVPEDGIVIVVGKSGRNEIITAPKRKGMVCIHAWTESNDADEISAIIKKFVSEVYDGMPEATRSQLPEYQKESLRRLLKPPTVSWKQVLKKYVGTIPSGHRKTKTRLSRRQPERHDISGQISSRIIKLIVAIDTSGSMDVETLQRIFVEIFAIIGTRMCEVTIIECDAKIQRIYKVNSLKDVSLDIQGRGGTSFVPVIEHINANRQLRDAILIYFTDGMGDRSIPKPLTFKTMWVLHNDDCQLSVKNPYGGVLVMD